MPHGHLLHRSSPDLRLLLEPLSRQQLLALGLSDLHEPTGGLPLLVAACVAARTGQQHKKEHGTQHGREHGKQHSQAVSAEVADRVLRALRSGDERAWRVVVACSVAGERFGTEEVARLAGLAVLEVAEIQERLCRERVLVDAGDGYAFRYPLVRQIVRDTVPAGRRRLLARHLRAGGDRRSTGGTAADGVERRVQGDRRRGTHVDLRSDRAAPVPLPV